jgi:hypothetical protein
MSDFLWFPAGTPHGAPEVRRLALVGAGGAFRTLLSPLSRRPNLSLLAGLSPTVVAGENARMVSPTDPAEVALDVFASWLSRREAGDGLEFDELVRSKRELAAELGALHATWKDLAA